MTERNEIVGLIDQAINAHRRNIARAEIRKADLGLAAPDILDISIATSDAGIERLIKLRDNAVANGNGKTTNGDRMDQISVQITGLQGELLLFHQDVSTEIMDLKCVVMELRDGCPLFNPDTPEGPLVFVRKQG